MTDELHLNVLPKQQLRLFYTLCELSWIKNFYLAGGTGLALQIGHRRSLDFDFFIPKDFNTKQIIPNLTDLGKFELFDEAYNTINGTLNGVNISFFAYKYNILKPFGIYKNIFIADPFDIAVMKLEAIAGRGSKKDFIDLYFLLKNYTLNDMIDQYPKKFGKNLANTYHIMKSLVYFEDAETSEMPVMLEKVSWKKIKDTIIKEVKLFYESLIQTR